VLATLKRGTEKSDPRSKAGLSIEACSLCSFGGFCHFVCTEACNTSEAFRAAEDPNASQKSVTHHATLKFVGENKCPDS